MDTNDVWMQSCRNCGTELVGDHCHFCGQKAHIHRTIGAFWHEIVHGALHFEGRMWRTLPLLAWKPGELTRRYIDGERSRFVSPVALFLFSIFLMFSAFQLSGVTSPADIGAPRKQTDATPEKRARLDVATGMDMLTIGNVEQGTALKITKTGVEWIDHGLIKWRDNPSLMLYKFQSNSYKLSWLLIIISIPFVWLLFAGSNRFNGFDHAVFVTYSISFMTMLMVVLTLLYRIGLPPLVVGAMATFIPPIHLFRDLRGAYGLPASGALWRLLALLLFITIVVALFLQLLWLIGISD